MRDYNTLLFKDAQMEELIHRAAEISTGVKREFRPMMLCSTSELIQELASRVPAMALGIQIPDDKERLQTTAFITGNKLTCWGLIRALDESCNMVVMQHVYNSDDEDGEDGTGDDDGDESLAGADGG